MSMELHVLSDRTLDSVAEWQRAIDREGFQLRLSNDVHFPTARGMLPVTLEGKQTGFECYHDDAMETIRFLGASHFTHFWKFALGLRWGADFSALEAAWMAGTAYAASANGIIFDHEEEKVFTSQQGREVVAKLVSDRPRIKAFMEELERKRSVKP